MLGAGDRCDGPVIGRRRRRRRGVKESRRRRVRRREQKSEFYGEIVKGEGELGSRDLDLGTRDPLRPATVIIASSTSSSQQTQPVTHSPRASATLLKTRRETIFHHGILLTQSPRTPTHVRPT
jgi:hypothetical protein